VRSILSTRGSPALPLLAHFQRHYGRTAPLRQALCRALR
jgi:hypothetical protein